MKRFVLWGLMFVLLLTIVTADELKITDIDAIVDGNFINNVDSNHIDLEVRSGDSVDLIIEFENEHRPSTNIDIEVLDLFVSLDDSIFISESMNFDIDAGEEVTRRVTFTVPNLEGSVYTLKIEVEGKDDDNHIQEDIEFINLILINDVNKFVEKIYNPEITSASTSEVRVRFADQSNVGNKDSEFPYLWISLIAFVIFVLILLILFLITKNR